MFRGFEGDERVAETVGLPVGLRLTPSIRMPGQAKDKFVMSPVLVGLVAIPLRPPIFWRRHARRAEKRQPDRMVVRFVRAILAVGEEGGPKATALVSQIDPPMGRDFKLSLLRIGPLNSAEIPVVGSIFVSGTEGEGDFEIGSQGCPVDRIAELHPVAWVAGRKTDCPHEF